MHAHEAQQDYNLQLFLAADARALKRYLADLRGYDVTIVPKMCLSANLDTLICEVFYSQSVGLRISQLGSWWVRSDSRQLGQSDRRSVDQAVIWSAG